MIFYFSATGNCKYVATRIAEATHDTIISITDCMKKGLHHFELSKGERIGFVTPVYFWGLPSVVVDFMEKLDVTAYIGQYCYHVLTYGTMTGQAHRMMDKHLTAKGLSLNAKYIVRMVDTWTPIFNLSDAEKNQALLQQAEPQIDKVIAQIGAGEHGDFNNRKIPLAELYYSTYSWQCKTSRFTVDDACIGCGLCQRQCPVSAIAMQNGRPQWVKSHCAICLGCLHRCPKFSIQYGRSTGKHGQYVNPKVSL